MTTKPPSGTGLAAVGPGQMAAEDAMDSDTSDPIGDILLDAGDKPLRPLTLPAPIAMTIKTPTPDLIDMSAMKTPAPLLGNADAAAATPGPVITKTPAPVVTRDPTSALPSIPPAQKEPSGVFPLPGMAPEASRGSDDDKTLIARLSVLDELIEESTKVEPIDAVLRAASSKPEPIALGDQAAVERDKALGVSLADRVAAAQYEEPGDDDMTVSATPGIISISDEDEDDEEPTASQRPTSARRTPTPTTGGLSLQTPMPLAASAPRLPPPGRPPRLPTPSTGLPPIPMPLVSPSSAPQRALTPSLPIPPPMGVPAPGASPASAIFNKVQLPMGGLVAFLVAAFGGGFVLGAYWWGGGQPAAPAPVAVTAPAPTPPAAAEPVPTPSVAAAAEPKPDEPKAAAPADEPKAVPAAEPAPAPAEPPVHHVVAAHPKAIVHKPTPATSAAPAAPKPGVAKPAAVAAKPAAPKGKAKPKAWVDPFAE